MTIFSESGERLPRVSPLTKILLFGSMLTCLLSACRTTPTSTAYRQSFGNAVIGETIGRIINPNAYQPEPQETAPAPVQSGEYFIVVNRATGESQRIEGSHVQLYSRIIKTKKRDEYPEGYIIYYYSEGIHSLTTEWTGKSRIQN